MAYSSVALFQGIPAVYAFLPPKVKRRRTATNTMAGWFDPRPALPNDSDGDEATSSGTSERLPPIAKEVRVPEPLTSLKVHGSVKDKGRPAVSQIGNKDRMVKRAAEGIKGKAKLVKRTVPEEKENAVSDSDAAGSLSSVPPSPDQKVPAPKDLPSNKPKASGFWRAHSSNTPDAPSPSGLKRKHSSLSSSKDDRPPLKKSCLSESRVIKHDWRAFFYAQSSPRRPTPSLTSLDSESDLQPKVRQPKDLQPNGLQAKGLQSKGVHSKGLQSKGLQSKGLQSKGLHLKIPPPQDVMQGGHVNTVYDQKLTTFLENLVVQEKPRILLCTVCSKRFESMYYMKMHFGNRHDELIAHLRNGLPKMDRDKQSRGPRKNVAVKKGWKGWVEEDLEPQKLILLDKPEVLPERTTRSGRKID